MSRPSMLLLVVAALASTGGRSNAQMPDDVAQQIRSMGRVIDPKATGLLLAPRVVDQEPYVDIEVERDVHYGRAERNLLDVFTPRNKSPSALPVLVFVHGGGFVAGNRRTSPTSPFYDNIAVWAVHSGMIGVNITYRLAPPDLWPAGSEDVGLAIRWVHDQIGAWGGDPQRVYLLGHSTGATHVASYLADPRFQSVSGSAVAGALLLSGIYRLSTDVKLPPNIVAYFGSDPAKYEERSPLSGLLANQVPLWVGSSEFDTPVLESQAQLLKDSLCGIGRCPAFVSFANHNHMSEVYSVDTADHSVTDAMLSFIQGHTR